MLFYEVSLIFKSNLDYNGSNGYNGHEGFIMQTITASEIKQNSTILQNALKSDMLITKRDKPFVVVVDYERYQELIAKSRDHHKDNWIDETFAIMGGKESDVLLDDIAQNRVNKEIDLWS